jgi:hypothetical protein
MFNVEVLFPGAKEQIDFFELNLGDELGELNFNKL